MTLTWYIYIYIHLYIYIYIYIHTRTGHSYHECLDGLITLEWNNCLKFSTGRFVRHLAHLLFMYQNYWDNYEQLIKINITASCYVAISWDFVRNFYLCHLINKVTLNHWNIGTLKIENVSLYRRQWGCCWSSSVWCQATYKDRDDQFAQRIYTEPSLERLRYTVS